MLNSQSKKMMLVTILIFVPMILALQLYLEGHKSKKIEEEILGTKIEQELNGAHNKVSLNDKDLENTAYFSLKEGETYNLVSDLDIFGEEVKVLKKKGNAFLAKGQYGTTLHFYRLYLIDQEGVNIFFEVTENQSEYENVELLSKKEDYDAIFNLASNQELFILKSPYEVGNEWGYGKIIRVDNLTVVVEFENGNQYTFEKRFGLTQIEYYLPKEMQEFYQVNSFTATRQEG